MPDGRRVNRVGPYGANGAGQIGGRASLNMMGADLPPNSSLLSMQAAHMGPMGAGYDFPGSELYELPMPGRPHYDMIPTIDTTFSSHPGSNYGSSPPADSRMGMSPIPKGLSVLDAPLPASFDSQGISHMARYGPLAASVPSRFPLSGSPPASVPKPPPDSATLRNLRTSAFGTPTGPPKLAFGSSPPASDEGLTQRMLHSSRLSRQSIMSSSLPPASGVLPRPGPPQGSDSEDDSFAFEEDLVPHSLHDLLTPAEKMRRFSRTADDEPARLPPSALGGTPDGAFASHTPPANPGSTLKVGSPNTASPSRYSAFFARNRNVSSEGKPLDTLDPSNGSPFGVVGSPLRNSSLATSMSANAAPSGNRPTSSPRVPSSSGGPLVSPSLRPTSSRPLSIGNSDSLTSTPRQASMSIISQQLQRARISSLTAAQQQQQQQRSRSPPSSSASPVTSATSGTSGLGGLVFGDLPPQISLSGLGHPSYGGSGNRSNRGSALIDKEEGLFSMEDEDGGTAGAAGGDVVGIERWPGSPPNTAEGAAAEGGSGGGLEGLGAGRSGRGDKSAGGENGDDAAAKKNGVESAAATEEDLGVDSAGGSENLRRGRGMWER